MSRHFLKQILNIYVLQVGITAKRFLKDKAKILPVSAQGIPSPLAEKPFWDLLTFITCFDRFSREPSSGQGPLCPVLNVVYDSGKRAEKEHHKKKNKRFRKLPERTARGRRRVAVPQPGDNHKY